jgi:hypothetical protein
VTTLNTAKMPSRIRGALTATALTAGLLTALTFTSPALASFGIESFENSLVTNEIGTDATQAGAHPYAMTTTILFNHHETEGGPNPDGDPKNLEVRLPAGLIVNPTATETTCTEAGLETVGGCPNSAAVGVATIDIDFAEKAKEARAPVFNITPPPGVPAELGFNVFGVGVVAHIVGKVRTGSDYGLSAAVLSIPQIVPFYGSKLTLWGDPSDPSHDAERGQCVNQPELGTCPTDRIGKPLLTLPGSCSGKTLTATMAADSWQEPETLVEPVPAESPAMTGCDALDFSPSITLRPDTQAADSPSGLSVDLKVPQEESINGLAEADLKDAVVTLPSGMAVNPAEANGLGACSRAQIDLKSPSAPACPDASKIGSVQIATPLLNHPLPGSVYLAQPYENPFGSPEHPGGALLAIYVAVDDPASGVVIKLAGHVDANAATGQLTTRFEGNPPLEGTPQLPFSDFKLTLFGGDRAPLVTPPQCSTYPTSSVLTPWSANAPSNLSSSFAITTGCGGGFAPSFSAGTTNNQAGGFSPLSATFSRQDGEQRLGGVTVHMPPGLLGTIAGIPLCGEAQANAGTCPAASQIGTATAGAGAGPNPFYVPEPGQPPNPVYLTGSYKGAPFGLSIVTHALAGPFDLGNVIVRAAISIDPRTAQITVTSDPLPTILQGVPLDLRTVNVTVDRPGFTFNPTNCQATSVTGTITSTAGGSAGVSSPFEAANCANLPFKPVFTASTLAHTSKQNGASLHVGIASAGVGQANIHRVELEIPKILPSRLTTLQKACTEAQFNTNPAGCPAASNIATAIVHTPLLNSPLSGPVYFVSHGGAAFPDTEIILQGEGVTLILDGHTDIKKGVTYSRFETVPDAPFTSFEFNAPEGPYSIFTAFGNLCTQSLVMPVTLTGQNGAQLKQSTKIAVSGCRAVTISNRRLSGKSVVLTFTLTAKGTVTITGGGLKRYRKTLGAGSHQVTVALSKRGLAARRDHRQTKITVALKSGSKTSSATTILKL